MKIFISWSGNTSKKIAEELTMWLPKVIQSVKPYFSPSDIEKGARWNSEISKELQNCNFGIIVLTKDNLEKPWIMYEAGSLAKQLDIGHVCPILFGIDAVDVKGPLVQFQATKFESDEVRALFKTVNSQCGEQKLTEEALSESFDMWWPKLEKKVSEILKPQPGEQKYAERPERDMIVEILELTRSLSTTKQPAVAENHAYDARVAVAMFDLHNEAMLLAKHFDTNDSQIEMANSIIKIMRYINSVMKHIAPEDISISMKSDGTKVVKRMMEIVEYLTAVKKSETLGTASNAE